MNSQPIPRLALSLASVVLALTLAQCLQPSASFAQGALTPPGPPAPMMKSLDQIEPRTPISAAPVVITNSGSYYLATNLTVNVGNAITIATNGVTLDLEGFTISSSSNSAGGTAIFINASNTDITILNGHIVSGVTENGGTYSGKGFAYGINVGSSVYGVRVSGMTVSGVLANGIYLGSGQDVLVESCVVRTAGTDGIVATLVKSSSATDCGSFAIEGVSVINCDGQALGAGTGIYASIVENSHGSSSGNGYGIASTAAQNCVSTSAGSGAGLLASTAQNCYGSNSGNGLGVYASGIAMNCYGNCTDGIGVKGFIGAFCHGTTATGMTFFLNNNVYSY